MNKKKQLDRFNQRRGHLGQTRPSSAQIGKLSVVNKPNAASPSSSDSEEFQRKTSEEEDTAMEEKEPTQPKPSGPIKVVSAPMVRSSTAPTTRTVTVMSTPAQNTKKVEDSESDEEDEDAWMTKYYKQELGIEDDTEPASKSKPLAPVESPKPVVTTATTTTVALTSTVKPTTSTVVSTVPAVVRPSTTPSQPVTYSGGNSSSAQSSWSAKPTSTAPLPSPSFLSSTPTQPASNVTANSTSFRANIQSAPTATANLGQTTTRPTTTPSLSFLSSPAPNPIPSTTVTSVPSEPSAASNKPIWLQGASASSSTAATPKAPPTNPTVDLKLDSTYTPAFTSDLARRRR